MGRTLNTVQNRGSYDIFLVAVILLLAGTGISMLFSVSYLDAVSSGRAANSYLVTQLLGFGAGCICAVALAVIPVPIIRKMIPWFAFGCLLLNILPVFFPSINGARRWIFLPGFSLQPSELLKFSTILYLAWDFVVKERKQSCNYLHSLLIIFLGIIFVVFLQSDLSTSIFISGLVLSMLFVSRLSFRIVIAAVLLIALIGGLAIFGSDYRRERMTGWGNQEQNTMAENYQISSSKKAIGSGGLWGRGIGNGIYKNEGRLPEAKSDFIFAVTSEELGFIGVLLIISGFAFLAYRGYRGAVLAGDSFCFYVAFGITTCILYQALVNMAVISGLFPTTGIPLPFFSQGGTSILVTMAMCGLLLNVTRTENGG